MKKSDSSVPAVTGVKMMLASSGPKATTIDSGNFVRIRDAASESPLHLDYQIHWRTEFRWRNALLALTGAHRAKALTPESACEAFAAKFPGRDITNIVAL